MTAMPFADLQLPLRRLSAPLPMWHAQVDAAQWSTLAQAMSQEAGRLVTLWGSHAGSRASVHAAFATPEGLVWAELPLAPGATIYPDLAPLFACATRLQRAVADLNGLQAEGAQDQRRWLDHGLWSDPTGPRTPPLAPDPTGTSAMGAPPGTLPAEYPFVRVEGDGVHEIAVGPVHAGIIEPGHFRFSVVGEKVLRLEQHLGYKHKGIEHRFTQLPALQAQRLAGRVSGDSTVAFAFGLAQFSRLREDWQRLSMQALGHRFMMDAVMPGGVACDLNAALRDEIRLQCDSVERELRRLRHIYDEHAGLQDRFMGTGRVSLELAQRLGLTGMAGRASGLANDLRCKHAWLPYTQLRTTLATQTGGDVAARVAVRFDEVLESLRLIRELCAGLPPGPVAAEVLLPDPPTQALGYVEGWRGEVLVALHLGAGGTITR